MLQAALLSFLHLPPESLQPCNIFVFDLANEMDDILELLSRQLEGAPKLQIPEWVKERHTDWYEKYLKHIEESKV